MGLAFVGLADESKIERLQAWQNRGLGPAPQRVFDFLQG